MSARARKVVLGVGNIDARIMFVGEAPGADEEVRGEPFVGPAGQLLNRMIAGTGLARADVYIGNIMNWRPEMPAGPDGNQVGNRPPTAEEMAYCMPYLRAQIAKSWDFSAAGVVPWARPQPRVFWVTARSSPLAKSGGNGASLKGSRSW